MTEITPVPTPAPAPESRWGLAALIASLAPVAVFASTCLAALVGIKDSQGVAYVFFFTLGAVAASLPVGAILATIGLLRRGRRHWSSLAAFGIIGLYIIGFAWMNLAI